MQVHRPDFASLIAALEANLPPEPKRAPLVTPPRPRLSRAEEDERYAGDRDETRDLPAPPMQLAAYREPRYIPEWERPVEVAVEVDLAGGESIFAPAETAFASTEWQSGPPPSIGWWPAETLGNKIDFFARYFDGAGWSDCVDRRDSDFACRASALESCSPTRLRSIQWRSHRLTGADWPEPAQAEEAPSVQAMMEAVYAANARIGVGYVALMHTQMCGSIEYKKTPANMRAEFIRRCNELR